MIDHITLLVKDYERSREFYRAALAPLGWRMLFDLTREDKPDLPAEKSCAFSDHDTPQLWLRPSEQVTPTHVALYAKKHALVDAFHAAALAAGATDHGAPGIRPYYPGYYAAFVLDPDGYNLEVVCRQE